MNRKEKTVGIVGYRTALKEIRYSDNFSGVVNYNVSILEDISLEECNENEFSLAVNWKIQFDPNDRVVSLSVMVWFIIDKEKTSKGFINDIESMKKYIDEKKMDYFCQTNARTHLSLIVAEITSWFGGNPLMIPAGLGDRK